MKKIFFLVFISIILLNSTSAQQDPGDVGDVLSNQFNIPKDNIPTSQEDIERIKQEFLKEKWTEFISKNKVFGPIHNFLTKISPVFVIVIAYPYEFSLTFLLILAIWIWVALRAYANFEHSGFVKGWQALAIGILIAIILAQFRLIKLIATFILDLIFKSENWWMRTIIIVVAFGVFAVVHVLSKMLEQRLKKQEEEKTKKESEIELKKMKSISEGVKTYREQT